MLKEGKVPEIGHAGSTGTTTPAELADGLRDGSSSKQ